MLVEKTDFMLKYAHMSLISEVNEQQRKAIEHGGGPQLIVAGAGTGKTRVITTRIAHLIMDKGVNIDGILALTFTEKAAEEMEERVLKMLPYGYLDLWISTFHAFCDKVLKQHALDVGLPSNYHLLDETATWLLIRKNLDRFNLDYYQPMGNPAKFIHALIKHFSRCKDEGISPDDYLKYAEEIKLNNDAAEFVKKLDMEKVSEKEKKQLLKQEILRVEEIANAYHVYQQILLENISLDFADLIGWTLKLFRERALILKKYQQQFKYILVDEFQDTNYVQYELIKLLAAPNNNITVVGDDDQSIYKFRGASISNIMQFKEDFPATAEVVLTENYRSRQEILDAAHKFIVQNNPFRLEVKLGIDKRLQSRVAGSAEVAHFHEKTVEAEASMVVRKIIELKNANQTLTWSDFAILVRANDSANVFLLGLEQASIPYQFLAMRGLYNKPVIIDLLSYLKLLDNYHEGPAVFRVLNFSFLGLETEPIVKIAHEAKKKAISLFEIVRRAAAVPGIDEKTVRVLNQLVAQIDGDSLLARDKKPSDVILNFLYHSGYLQQLQKTDNRATRESLDYLQQFYKKVQGFEATVNNPRLADFMAQVEMEMEAGESGKLLFDLETGPDMVKVLTVHGAKGLEFEYVFITNLVDRKFPTDERRETIEIPDALVREKIPAGDFHLAEERRLFYVAMTRAKKGLFFTSADDYGGSREKKLSRFLFELGYKKTVEAKADGQRASAFSEKKESAGEGGAGTIKYEAPRRFSFSQMQTYEACPLKYKLANVVKIPTFGNHYFTFGSTIHNTLQKFLAASFTVNASNQRDLFGARSERAERLLPLEKLYEIYSESWQDDWFLNEKQKMEYFAKGKELLKNFHKKFLADQPKVKYLEQTFNIKLDQYIFSGRIDRVDELPDGKAEIIDYKTGQGKESLSTDDRRQLLFYQIAAETKEVLNLKLAKLTYYYLESNATVSFLGKEADKQKLKQRFLENVHQIERQNFAPTPDPHVCGFCEYKGICEFKKL